jgi:NAD(P)-dependent dehydrogenase (short-subunit alcohol dehydrogenase family)
MDSTAATTITPITLIVGASGGIGSATARLLTAQGHTLILAARNAEKLSALAAELSAEAHSLDMRESSAVDALLAAILEKHGRIDGLANCIGSLLLKPAHLTTDAEFADTLAQNLMTSFHLLRAAARPMMKQSTGGSIVFCSSVAAARGIPNHEAIAAAKAAIEGLARSAAATYARQNIRINCVAPGLTRTPLTKGITQNEAVAKASAALHPLGKLGEPADIASAICWLLDARQHWLTGQTLAIDGGMSTLQPKPGL